jgi:predicted HicB family RNase H-like nuclease
MPAHTKPRKVGRPKLPKGYAKAGKVQIRLNPDEQKRIEAAAKASDKTVSEWARSILLATVGA